ncbi:MAG: CSLREA domain-containing protein, partial [Pyrinomonadaceae bacterium]
MKNLINARISRRACIFPKAKSLVFAVFAVIMAFGILSLTLLTPTTATQELEKLSTPAGRSLIEIAGSKPAFRSLGEAVAGVIGEGVRHPTAELKLTANDAANADNFGYAVAISGDYAVVGSTGNDSPEPNRGAVYFFVRDGAGWSFQQKISRPEQAASGSGFGYSVALEGDTAVVGVNTFSPNGAAWVYVRSGSTWVLQQRLTSPGTFVGYGKSVAISGDTVVVGDIGDVLGPPRLVGSAHVFVRNGTAWTEQQTLTASDASVEDYFGMSVSIRGDRIVIGAGGADGAGTAFGPGAVYIFERVETAWTQRQKIPAVNPSVNETFGTKVLLGDGLIAVTAFRRVYLFTLGSTSWTFRETLTSPNNNNFFGEGLALSGEYLLVGAPLDDASRGAVYLYSQCAPPGTPPTKISPTDAAARNFGWSLAASGDEMLTGAIQTTSSQGAAYVVSPISAQRPSGAQCTSEIVVNTTGDEPDADLEDDECDVDLMTSGNQCTLRAAIETANDLPGPDTITFNIPGDGVRTISPATNLPQITSQVNIDASTQPAYSNLPLIQIVGSLSTDTGLEFTAGSNTSSLVGVSVYGFSSRGVLLASNGNSIKRSHIGTDSTGMTAGKIQPVG